MTWKLKENVCKVVIMIDKREKTNISISDDHHAIPAIWVLHKLPDASMDALGTEKIGSKVVIMIDKRENTDINAEAA